MKRRIVYDMNGLPVTRFSPENDVDMAELYHMAERGELDMRESFGDDPEVWERWQRERQGVEPRRKVYVVVNGVHRLQDAPSDNN